MRLVSVTLQGRSLDAAQRAAATAAVGVRLREILARKRMDNVRFDVVPTDDLPVNPRTRKFQLILDRRSPQLTTLAAQTLSYR